MCLPPPLYSSYQWGITVRFRTQNIETKVERDQSLTSAGETAFIRVHRDEQLSAIEMQSLHGVRGVFAVYLEAWEWGSWYSCRGLCADPWSPLPGTVCSSKQTLLGNGLFQPAVLSGLWPTTKGQASNFTGFLLFATEVFYQLPHHVPSNMMLN